MSHAPMLAYLLCFDLFRTNYANSLAIGGHVPMLAHDHILLCFNCVRGT